VLRVDRAHESPRDRDEKVTKARQMPYGWCEVRMGGTDIRHDSGKELSRAQRGNRPGVEGWRDEWGEKRKK